MMVVTQSPLVTFLSSSITNLKKKRFFREVYFPFIRFYIKNTPGKATNRNLDRLTNFLVDMGRTVRQTEISLIFFPWENSLRDAVIGLFLSGIDFDLSQPFGQKAI